ncbi:DUF3604 domain-containing protein [Algoriphagus sediminis]|uniref:DUF3604 domain-containing protein n=1 Tax=Algoriphagus sediminis TaxID=3057113 RepID=A0ABT7YDT0_9BACT|nr:DUF3604 domain-containing protein [Algoriphagus sediminis]MDN3204525.1 DUF3604 domain-containing protein [Algoriphagus sediminis]
MKAKHFLFLFPLILLGCKNDSNSLNQSESSDAETQTIVSGQPETAKDIDYSPHVGEDYPTQAFFGDTHLHTSYSSDAGMFGNTLGPADAYRFALGEEVISSSGIRAQLRRPLDFLVISDHAENLGLAPAINSSNPDLLATEFGAMLHGLVKNGGEEGAMQAFDLLMVELGKNVNPLPELSGLVQSMWNELTDAAEQFNRPGHFTALIGYEWGPGPEGANLHRNVIFRGDKEKADQIIPYSAFDSEDPEDLWEWMANYEKLTGDRVLAIPHGGNLSNGLMFDDVTQTDKKPIDRDYAERRMRWEPLYEVTQMKGDAEAHPLFSTNDEFADYGNWDRGSFGPIQKTPDMLPKEYARPALKRGLAYEAKLGVNPFKFGLIGSSDAHTSLATTDEDNFFGKVVILEPSANPIRFEEVVAGRPGPPAARMYSRETLASGLAGVWARENTREALWDAMSRKEVFATTGTRMKVRVFGGFDFVKDDLYRSNYVKYGYEKGVPMGGDLVQAPAGKAPSFLIVATRDPDGANLDRVQIIKGWLDASGETQERIYDVAVSGGRKIGSNGRATEPVGNTVNVEDASYTNSIGAPVLEGYWTDPDFDPSLRAFYYIRALEIPTPNWTTYDAKVFGIELPEDVEPYQQERAYSSPIWYSPN